MGKFKLQKLPKISEVQVLAQRSGPSLGYHDPDPAFQMSTASMPIVFLATKRFYSGNVTMIAHFMQLLMQRG